jgi:membrane associated rhomboid family serine protease
MGLYDRDYSRSSSTGSPFPRMNYPFTGTLSVLALVCFVLSLFLRGMAERMALSWDHLVSDQWFWTLFTHPFFHPTNSPLFILFNLLVIYFFGRELEERLGWKGMAWISGTAVALGATVFLVGSGLGWLEPGQRLLGLSGVANAVLVAGVLLDPRRSILFFFVLAVPGWLLVVFSLLMDLWRMSQGDMGAGQAAADIAGLAAGGICFQVLTKAWQWRWPNRPTTFRRRGRPRLAVYRGEAHDQYPDSPSRAGFRERDLEPEAAEPQSNLNLEVDRILEKISQQGLPSLTDGERRILLKASESLKKKP